MNSITLLRQVSLRLLNTEDTGLIMIKIVDYP